MTTGPKSPDGRTFACFSEVLSDVIYVHRLILQDDCQQQFGSSCYRILMWELPFPLLSKEGPWP